MTPRKVVILCGGFGTRLREESEFKPKPLVMIGTRPILWHIMKHYSHFGHKDFILCTGYKGHMLKEFFLNFDWMIHDFTLNTRTNKKVMHEDSCLEEWNITFADTGLSTPTGGRVKKIEKYIDDEDFFLTYGDGLSNVDINRLHSFHKKKGRNATLTAVHPASPFGILDIRDGMALNFKEKPRLKGLINGGFFVFNQEIFDYLNEDSVLEEEPLRRLSLENQLAAYEHKDFWSCMDTFKDVARLNSIWESGNVPWKTRGCER